MKQRQNRQISERNRARQPRFGIAGVGRKEGCKQRSRKRETDDGDEKKAV
jgi:hypothetical protein